MHRYPSSGITDLVVVFATPTHNMGSNRMMQDHQNWSARYCKLMSKAVRTEQFTVTGIYRPIILCIFMPILYVEGDDEILIIMLFHIKQVNKQ